MKNFTINLLTTVIFMTVFSFALKAQTPVSGGIYSNTTWTKAKSPYIVTDAVVVFSGVTLTIEPGVTVKFNDHKTLEIRQGNIFVLGTKTDSITFTSIYISPKPALWEILLNDDISSNFNYCNFLYATTAINRHTHDHVGVLKIIHSNFKSNQLGVFINTSNFSSTFIDSCNFRNDTIASDVYGNVKINHCIFSNNRKGITIGYSTLRNSIIDSNGVGVRISLSDSVFNCTITNNNIGLQNVEGIGFNVVTKNVIENNNNGIWLNDNRINIYCNKICNNTLNDLYYNVISNSLNADNNYWCTTDSAIIASHIYDGYDNTKLGLVTFIPIDTSKCYLTGCNLQLTATVINATCDTCHNGTATVHVSNGVAPYTWTWYTSPIQITQSATKLKSGTYSVCVTDAKGCTACNNNVFVDSTNCTGFSVKAFSANETCITCADGRAWVHVTGGTKPYSYSWYTNPLQSTDTAKWLAHGSYYVCVTDLYGCAACDSVKVKTGNCSAHFDIYPTSTLHVYNAVNKASGVNPIKYLWSWGDGTTDTTAYPNHIYSKAGFYKICLTITDFAGCVNTFCNSYYLQKSDNPVIKVNVIPTIITGIKDINNDNPFNIYPNPASENIIIESNNNVPQSYVVSIKNIQGQQVLNEKINFTSTHAVNVCGLNNGVYILTLQNEKVNYVSRVVIQK